MATTLLLQATLKSGTTIRTCWLDAELKVGQSVKLKNSEEPDRWWEVIALSTTPTTAGQINRGWNNNI